MDENFQPPIGKTYKLSEIREILENNLEQYNRKIHKSKFEESLCAIQYGWIHKYTPNLILIAFYNVATMEIIHTKNIIYYKKMRSYADDL